jgi:hypothetical protein
VQGSFVALTDRYLRNPATCLDVARLKVSRKPKVTFTLLDDEAH